MHVVALFALKRFSHGCSASLCEMSHPMCPIVHSHQRFRTSTTYYLVQQNLMTCTQYPKVTWRSYDRELLMIRTEGVSQCVTLRYATLIFRTAPENENKIPMNYHNSLAHFQTPKPPKIDLTSFVISHDMSYCQQQRGDYRTAPPTQEI